MRFKIKSDINCKCCAKCTNEIKCTNYLKQKLWIKFQTSLHLQSSQDQIRYIFVTNRSYLIYICIYWVDDCCYVGQVKSIVRISRSSSISWLELSTEQMFAANTSGSVLFLSRGLSCITLNIQTNNKGHKFGSFNYYVTTDHHHQTLPGRLDCLFLTLNFGIKCNQYFIISKTDFWRYYYYYYYYLNIIFT